MYAYIHDIYLCVVIIVVVSSSKIAYLSVTSQIYTNKTYSKTTVKLKIFEILPKRHMRHYLTVKSMNI